MSETRAAARSIPTLPLFEVPVALTDYDGVIGLIRRWLTNGSNGPLTMDAANAMSLANSCVDERLRVAMLRYDLILPDSRPLLWSLNAKGARLSDVVSGPYLVPRILAELPRRTRIALIGGYRPEHRAIVEHCRPRFPLAEFVLLQEVPDGEIDRSVVDRCLERIEEAGAELVFVLLGVPRQYYWVGLAEPGLGRRVCLSVGGAFNFMIGRNHYAPRWMQRSGLWWLYRVIRDPRRLTPRYVKYNPLFLWFLLTREVLPAVSRRRDRP